MGMPKGAKKLAFKHRIAVLAHLNGRTKKAAMLEAGYSKNTLPQFVFDRPDVISELTRAQDAVAEKYEISREWITEQLKAVATAGTVLAKFKKVDPKTGALMWDFRGATEGELALIDTLTVSETTTPLGKKTTSMKVAPSSRLGAIEVLCRIHGYNKDTLDIPGLGIVERLQRGRERAGVGKGEKEEDAN